MTLNVGDKAPSFALYNTNKELVSKEQFDGNPLVILFFPLAFSSVCTDELCGVRDDKSYYDDLGASIVGISVDSVFSLKKFQDEQGYDFTMLSDFNKETCRAYGAIYEEAFLGMKGVAKRSAFVLDDKGIVRYAEVLENAGDLPNFDKIKTTLKNLG